MFQDSDVLSDRDVAKLLFKDQMKPTSWKSVQRLARNGDIRGQQVGRRWRFHVDAVRDFLMRQK